MEALFVIGFGYYCYLPHFKNFVLDKLGLAYFTNHSLFILVIASLVQLC